MGNIQKVFKVEEISLIMSFILLMFTPIYLFMFSKIGAKKEILSVSLF